MSAMDWALEATPQTPEEACLSQPFPEIVEAAVERGITSIVHFTRARPGLVGILDSSAIKSRRDLPQDARLKYAYEENAMDRSRDIPWHGYVNLSVTTINVSMFNSSRGWHPDAEWVIFEFKPEILGDPGVVFSTTNNAYTVAQHGRGLRGFEQMFAPRVPWGELGSVRTRRGRRPNQTTDPQAEVLYPLALSLVHLHTITVGDEGTYDTVVGALATFPRHTPDIVLKPEAFQ